MNTFGFALWASVCLLIAGSALAHVLPLTAAAGRLPELPSSLLQPKSAPIELTIGGVPAALQVVSSKQPPSTVLAAIEASWRESGNKVRRDDNGGGWRSVSRVNSQRIEVVQLRAHGDPHQGSEGYVVRWRLEQVRTAAGLGRDSLAHRLLPPAAVSLSDTASDLQSPASGRTLVAWAPLPVAVVDRQLESRAATLGLRRRSEFEGSAARTSLAAGERARFYAGAGAEIAVTLHSEGSGTALVIHLMETTR